MSQHNPTSYTVRIPTEVRQALEVLSTFKKATLAQASTSGKRRTSDGSSKLARDRKGFHLRKLAKVRNLVDKILTV